MKTGIELIAAERERQIKTENWSPEHDDGYLRGELCIAAACYIFGRVVFGEHPQRDKVWPFAREWWKPSADPIRNLTKAGALIAAEIDRLQRAASVPNEKS